MSRRDPVARDTRARLLEAALTEFARKGLASTTIEDIAERAGTTKGAIYYYFSDKFDLAADLQADLWNRLAEQAGAALDESAGTIDNLVAAFGAFVGSLGEGPEARFFLRDCWYAPELDQPGRQVHETSTELVRGVLADGVTSGDIDPALDLDAVTRVVLGVFAEATLHILTTGRSNETTEVVERLIRSLAPPGSVGRAPGGRAGERENTR